MFTGIIEEIGILENIIHGKNEVKLTVKANKVLEKTKLGDSICTNGVCLTVTNINNNSFDTYVMPETLRKTAFSRLRVGSRVNLERALSLEDRLGGHIVSGHIDGIGIIEHIKKEENATWVSISADNKILKYIVYKGSIAIDGISLTVSYIDEEMFKVSIIPHTAISTSFLNKKQGDVVNLECDVIGKYIEKFMVSNKREEKNIINEDFLRENGFI